MKQLKSLLFIAIFTTSIFADRVQVEQFVERFYNTVLDRGSDSAGLNHWTDELVYGTKAGSDIARGFIFSAEFTNRNTDNDYFIYILYRSFFDRNPDDDGFSNWTNQLNRGVSRYDILNGFLYSLEFENLCRIYGISAVEATGYEPEPYIESPIYEPNPYEEEYKPEVGSSLADTINNYRVQQGLSSIPISASLTRVAQAHVQDMVSSSWSEECNLHSWSYQGSWSGCCYTSDHAQAQCMWDKPREITNGVYSGYGYEISAGAKGYEGSAKDFLSIWQASQGHHDVILNRSIWNNRNWRAMGAAMLGGYAVVWFGEEEDRGY